MDKLYTDLTIHSIMVPIATKELVFTVGQSIATANLLITRIERDDANYEFFKKLRYVIYAKGKDEKEFIWRSISEDSNPIITFKAND